MKRLRESGALFVSLVALLILFGSETLISVRELERTGYDALQLALSAIAREPQDRLVVVDLTDLPTENGNTPREPLKKVLKGLQLARAKAVGIDVDFSPEESNRFVDPGDPAFFEYCRNLGIPIFLGVSRMAGRGRDAWLGGAQYATLAASIIIPRDSAAIAEQGIPGPYPLSIPKGDASALPDGGHSDDLASMAFRLASESARNNDRRLSLDDSPWNWISVSAERPIDETRKVSEFAVDYHFVSRFAHDAITPNWKTDAPFGAADTAKIAGSFVLLGDVEGSSAADTFERPGRGEKISGVLVHATAAMTLLEPLRVLKPWARTVIDVICAIALAIFFHDSAKGKPRGRPHAGAKGTLVSRGRVRKFLILTVITAVLAWAVLTYRILWFDWLAFLVGGLRDAMKEKAIGNVTEATV